MRRDRTRWLLLACVAALLLGIGVPVALSAQDGGVGDAIGQVLPGGEGEPAGDEEDTSDEEGRERPDCPTGLEGVLGGDDDDGGESGDDGGQDESREGEQDTGEGQDQDATDGDESGAGDAAGDEGGASGDDQGDGLIGDVLGRAAKKDKGSKDDGEKRRKRQEHSEKDVIDGQYIVVYDESVDRPREATRELERECGVDVEQIFTRALEGFSADLTDREAEELEEEPEIETVVPDRRVHMSAPLQSGDLVPPGIRRIGAATTTAVRPASGVNVAVIDTGIDLDHPDLNVASGKDCTGAGTTNDGNGHGTHVAGTIGARNNGSGVVGVAPDTKLYAVRVLNNNGDGSWSQIICGIDWVTATRKDSTSGNDIAVANMSLGGTDDKPAASCSSTTDPLHKAICNSTNAGVTYVVAAGNSSYDYDYQPMPDVPAVFPEVLTVTAMADTDGQGGAKSNSCEGDPDDRAASFSNFAQTDAGKRHTIAAPGVCIRSTVPNGYGTFSGTSMATPHVTGAVALCLNEGGQNGACAGLKPADIIQRMRDDAAAKDSADSSYGFGGDPTSTFSGQDWYYGFLVTVRGGPGGSGGQSSAVPYQVQIDAGTWRSGNVASLAADDGNDYKVKSTGSGTRTASWYGLFNGVSDTVTALTVSYRGKRSVTCTQTISMYDFTTRAWVPLDTRTAGTSESEVVVTVTASPTRFINNDGVAAVQVRCTHGSKSFSVSGDQLRITQSLP